MSTWSRATIDSSSLSSTIGMPLRVQRAGELGRVGAAVDVGDLRRRERDHLDAGVVPVHQVEVVEVAARGAEDDDAFAGLRRGR